MSTPLVITVVTGTNRPGSRTRRVCQRLLDRYAGIEGVQAELLDLAELPAALFSPAAYADKPSEFARFSDRVLASDGLHIVSPEYNGGMPGVLKLFIDHLPFPDSFERRPVAFVGIAAGRFGALRPIEQLQGIFGYRNAHIYPPRVFIAGAVKALDSSGEPTDPTVAGLLDAQVAGFVDFARALRR
mgnify:CR=1 FL=1